MGKMEITAQIPYGHGKLELSLAREDVAGIFRSMIEQERPRSSGMELVDKALAQPIGSSGLAELARSKRTAVIIASDHTRPVPSKVIMPPMLRELRRGNPEIQITILIATGFHRATTEAELRRKFGDEIVDREHIVVHDCQDQSSLAFAGILPSGGELWLNKLALETDLLLAEGFIEPHFFAGFSGGRKSVLPGIAGRTTVLSNHCAAFIDSEFARTGNLENNPLHRDMLWAAKKAGLAFIVNVILNGEKEVVRAFAGDAFAAHETGCREMSGLSLIKVPESEIVITSNGGYPLDQNLYQAVKGMTAAEAAVAPGGVIIIAAACQDGHGGEGFYRTLAEAKSPAEVLEKLRKVPATETVPDQWESQILARVLSKNPVIVVTEQRNHAMIQAMHMQAAGTLEEALMLARRKTGSSAKIAIIPDGVSVIVRVQGAGDRGQGAGGRG
ncbi:MAG: nickel-dependent lactate racemase [Lentisphaerae bacterium]|jgi:nickel-dependent lactate racemase|nr:nickel-dependent lactate racemase [Lentisphaerota bacterium]